MLIEYVANGSRRKVSASIGAALVNRNLALEVDVKEIQNLKSGLTTVKSDRLADALVKTGKFGYATREMRADPRLAPIVQPAVAESEVEISPRTGKPKRQYRRRSVESTEEE